LHEAGQEEGQRARDTQAPLSFLCSPGAPNLPPQPGQVKYILGYSVPRVDTLHESLYVLFKDIKKFKWQVGARAGAPRGAPSASLGLRPLRAPPRRLAPRAPARALELDLHFARPHLTRPLDPRHPTPPQEFVMGMSMIVWLVATRVIARRNKKLTFLAALGPIAACLIGAPPRLRSRAALVVDPRQRPRPRP
jgi:hypothetical protein